MDAGKLFGPERMTQHDMNAAMEGNRPMHL